MCGSTAPMSSPTTRTPAQSSPRRRKGTSSMIARLLEEPEMQFGRGAHVDPRFGLLDFGPADHAAEAAPATIPIGVVGSQETIEGVLRWLRRCRKPIDPPADKRTSNFFPPFPGFAAEV